MHNASKYIERCLNSLYHQDIDELDFEVIIVDDGSTDNSVELVETFQESHSNIRLYREKNTGAYTTRNKLLQLARGTYIYCIDADDYLAYNSLGKLLDTAIAERLELICFNTEVTDAVNLFLTHQPIPENFKPKICSGQDFIRDYPNHRVEIWWYMIRREFLEGLGFEFGNNQYNADVVFTLRLLMNSQRIGYAPYSVHRYYQSSDSLMRTKDPFKRKRLLIAIFNMVKDLDIYVDSVTNSSNELSEDIIAILNKRRDQFSFFFLIKLSVSGMRADSLKRKVESLKEMDVYPLRTYIGNKYSFKYQLLNLMINNEHALFPLALLYRFIKKFQG